MGKKSEDGKASRRDFLKLASVSAPAAVAAATLSGPAQADTIAEEAGEGLRDTAHTRAYYESLKF